MLKLKRLTQLTKLAFLKILTSRAITVLVPALLFTVIFVALPVLAAEAVATPVNPDLTDPGMIAKLVLNAIAGKQWGIVVCGAVLLLIGTAKKFLPDPSSASASGRGLSFLEKVGAWLHSKPGGWLTNFLTTGALSLLTAFLAGQPVSVNLLVGSVFASLSGAGLLELIRDIFKKDDPSAAQAAGAAAAANPKGTLNG